MFDTYSRMRRSANKYHDLTVRVPDRGAESNCLCGSVGPLNLNCESLPISPRLLGLMAVSGRAYSTRRLRENSPDNYNVRCRVPE